MCYISDWPKRFLKTVLLQLSRHQVCSAGVCVCVCARVFWLCVRSEMVLDVCLLLTGGVSD